MAYTLAQTINWSSTFSQYSPQTAGSGQEPAVSTASMIRSTILSAPFTWPFNRGENATVGLLVGQQDYVLNISDFGFIEKASLTDSNGNIWEIKDVLNVAPLAVASAPQGRPASISVVSATPYTSVKLRFSPVPDAVYTLNLTYQKAVSIMGPFLLSSAANEVAGNTTYTGVFDTVSFPVGSVASITGFTTPANNGLFSVVSVTSTTLVLANPGGVAEATIAYAANFNWSPLPDSFMYIYNSLYLGEIMAVVDDARAQQYRQRGVASLLAKAEGLTETQKNSWAQQWLARGVESASVGLKLQQAIQGRGV